MPLLTEDNLVEQPAINWFKENGYSYIHGSELSPENDERDSYRDVILKHRFLKAIKRLNPWLNDVLSYEIYKKITDLEHPDFLIKGKIFYEMLANGVKITFKAGKEERTGLVRLIDLETPENNEFLIANQYTVEYQYQREIYRRPDLVVFINGIPVSIFEFKSFNADETAKDAFLDHKIKMQDIPQLYVYSQILAVSDGLETKYGSPTSDWERFFVWEGVLSDDDVEIREMEGGQYRYFYNGKEFTSLEILIKGLFRKEHLIEFLNDFIVYERSLESYEKKIAIYHQFYTVKKAIERTKKAVLEGNAPEERRIGVVWHTQGSGKSLTMLFYARKALKIEELKNPLLLFITDRQNLDEQLSSIFANVIAVSKQAESIKDLQESIMNTAGGIIFATIQKFGKKKIEEYPFLSNRKNIIVIADEAHRSQYRELAQNLRRAIPNASFMGFTATPIELQDRDTYLVFGEPISIYSMDRARRHNVVVPIYYEARLPNLHLTNEFIDEEFEEISDSVTDEPEVKESLKKRFARLESLMLVEERLEKIARDIVEHFNKRIKEIEGKAMIVTISRKVAVELYKRIIAQPDTPRVEVVISGNKTKDPEDYWPHLRNKQELDELVKNFANPEADPKMVIVADMWLTGSDFPCLHTMYFDKPMKNHSLAQAIARVNRVFKDKPGGLIVDYIGIADDLRKSLSIYTVEKIRDILVNIQEVLNLLREKYDIVISYFAGIDLQSWQTLPQEELSKLIAQSYEKICSDEEKKKNFLTNFIALKRLYALASPHPETIKIKDDLRFFEMIKKMIVKYTTRRNRELTRDFESEINQLISKSISAEEPVDIFSLMKKEKPDVSLLDDKFLAEFIKLEYKNYAAELLIKIIKDELRIRMKRNSIRYRRFNEMLEGIIEKYNVRLLTAVDIIEKLIQIAREIRKAQQEGKTLGLTEEELAFYDLLSTNNRIFKNYQEIEKIAKEIVKELGYYIKIVDWNKKETIRAKIKSALKQVLIRRVKEGVPYEEIDKLSGELLKQSEQIYLAA